MKSLLIDSQRFSQPDRPRGFTLVELLVVIAIIGVLVALLLPAVQAAREAARRCSCLNNISQIALAVHNHEFSREHLPSGVINPEGPIRSEEEGQHVGWLLQIAPYMEMQTLYRNFDIEAGAYAATNSDVRKATVGVYICPSYPGSEFNGAETAAVGTYAGCHNDVEAPIDTDNNGLLFLNSNLRFTDILDGSSQTFMFGEMRPLKTTGQSAGEFGGGWSGRVNASLGWVSGTRSSLRNTSGMNENLDWHRNGLTESGPSGPLGVGGFASAHPGGAQFAYGDGSCQFVNEDIQPQAFQQYGHRADGVVQEQY